ncbi:MAG: response regulator [Muribaculaceae bacterium]|nr:response regulator [Muribaculaceae bacterium]
MTKRTAVALLTMVITAILACAQEQALSMRHVSHTAGLPNNYVTALYKDSRGFLWIGSSAGLFRYDGFSARKVAEMVDRNSGVLSEQTIGIQEDSKRRLWVQSEASHAIYDPETNTLIDWISDYIRQFGITDYATAVFADDNGDIWIATDKDGLYRLDIQGNKAEKATSTGQPYTKICSLTSARGKIIGVTSSASLLETDPATMKTRLLAPPPEDPYPDAGHHRIYSDAAGHLWIINTDRILLYNLDKASWQNSLLPAGGHVGVVKEIREDSKGNLWIARDHKGIERLEMHDGKFIIVPVATSGDFSPQSTVSAILEDDNGTLLFGTYKLGLYAYNESVEKFRTERFPGQSDMPDVNCMLTSRDGSVWIGSDNSGLWKWTPADNERRHIADITEDAEGAITCLAESPEGKILIGKFARGLFAESEGKVARFATGSDIDRSYVWSMAFDRDGILWIGTLGNGVFRYDPRRRTADNLTTKNSGLKSDFITSILPSEDGKVYIGSSGGIRRYDPATGEVTPVRIGSTPSLSDIKVIQIFEDSRGLLWIATTSGLKVLDRKRDKVFSIPTGASAQGVDVLGIAEDNRSHIWVSSSARLTDLKVTFDDSTGEFHVSRREYDSHSGLPDYDFNQRSFARLADGSIAVGGPFGITWFNPSGIRMNVSRPKVIFTDLYMDGHPVNPGEEINGKVPLKKAIHSEERIELSHNAKDFTIFFASDNYALPEKTRFRYRLEGYNDQWTECPEGINYVSYTNLSPGTYRLQVTAVNEDGYESEHPASIQIRIHHSFWGSPWGWGLYALAAAACVWIIVLIARKRERRLLYQRNLEESRRKQEELNQMKFRFFTNVSHDLRTPLSLIVSPLEDMLKESTDSRQTKRLNLMRNNALRLLSLVNQLLDFRKSEESELGLNPSEGDIVAFARNVCNSFLSLSERKDIHLTFYSDEERIDMLFDSDKMEKILMNLLGNAFKFTPSGGRIDVAIDHSGDNGSNLRIKVADTGIGIKDKDKKRIFERFYQVDDEAESHPGTGSGIGLSMVSEYVRLHEGSIRVVDNVEKGSVFIIEIPIRHVIAANDQMTSGKEADDLTTVKLHDNQSDETKEPDRNQTRRTALVVDDSLDMTEMLKDSLDGIYEVVTVHDGRKALEKARQLKPDIILTDLMMPGMNGMELCRALKEDRRTVNIPIIILTAKHDLGVKLEGLTIGADDYITKPFNLDVLRLRMRRLIELSAKGARRTLIEPEPDNIRITPIDEKLIEKAVKYVSQNLSRPELSVEELSDHLGMSRVSLYKKIKQITGKSPLEFIRIIRLKRAAQLLRESQLNVSEIAYKTGFNNPKMFSRYFKEEFGILPSAYQDKEGAETNYTL